MIENFYLNNPDLKFHIEKMVDWQSIIELHEEIGSEDCPYDSIEEAVEAYIDLLTDPVGELAATRIEPRAEAVDKQGCAFENGEVIFPKELQSNIQDITDAQLSGISMDREYGGLGMTKTFYAAANEIISRADASLMNYFGLQGIGETIQHFGSDELKNKYLEKIASGEYFAAMLLTEADAGSELGSMRTKAVQDPDTGQWTLTGTKRFITFGCGDVLLTMARSEDPEEASGPHGISLFVVEKGEGVTIRRIESKLGIHGSPTCEIHFNNAPAFLVGERGKGLIRYGLWLMKEARLAVAGQAVGICQAALTAAAKYANEREQFGQKIKKFPQIAEMLADMQVYTEASRTLLYAASQIVDLEQGYKKKGIKGGRKYARLSDIVTPLAKYYTAEMSIKIANDAIQIHGGNGFTTDYPVERFLRDARITNIYEGTSQIQVAWAIPKILNGGMKNLLAELSEQPVNDSDLAPLLEKARKANAILDDTIAFVKQKDSEYWDLVSRSVVDMAIDVYLSYEFIRQAEAAGDELPTKKLTARRFINQMLPRVEMNSQYAMNGELLELF